MKQIALTQGKYALVDDEDFEYLNQWKWHARKGKNTFYAQSNFCVIKTKKYISMQMHHVIIGGPLEGFVGDHENGNGLDNRRKNLRHITPRQNSQNKQNKKGSSMFPGVSWDKSRQKWMAHITINKKQKNLGRFVDEFKAFEVYRQAVETIGEEVIS